MKILPAYFVFFMVINGYCYSQYAAPSNQKNKVSGKVIEAETGLPLPAAMILNKRTNTGVFGSSNGEFSTQILKQDTLVFSVIGYETKTICFKDSLWRHHYEIVVQVSKLEVNLRKVEIFPERSFKEIQKEIDNLGTDHHYKVQGLGAIASPISFFYERFSQFEKQKRKAAELYNEENKKEVLKALLRKYVKADIVDLDDRDFDEFILFCQLPEEFIKNASQYDLIIAVKNRYKEFKELKRQN